MEISYYELLGMIKEENIPKLVYWINHERKKIAYKSSYDSVDNSFNCYILQNRKQETEDIKFYLSECMVESSFFDKCIEIPNDDFEDILEMREILCLDYDGIGAIERATRRIVNENRNMINQLIKNQKKIIQKLKEKK